MWWSIDIFKLPVTQKVRKYFMNNHFPFLCQKAGIKYYILSPRHIKPYAALFILLMNLIHLYPYVCCGGCFVLCNGYTDFKKLGCRFYPPSRIFDWRLFNMEPFSPLCSPPNSFKNNESIKTIFNVAHEGKECTFERVM